jgi:hypothetical protein
VILSRLPQIHLVQGSASAEKRHLAISMHTVYKKLLGELSSILSLARNKLGTAG